MNKDWNGNSKASFAILGASNHSKDIREENDWYATHPDTVKLFLKYCKEHNLILPKKCWEPCCGDGSISKVLEDNDFDVYSSDLYDRQYGESNVDLLKLNKNNLPNGAIDHTKLIITNPPYKMALECVNKCLELVDDDGFVIMFLKIQFLETDKRYNLLFNKNNLKRILVHTHRQGCGKSGTVFKNSSAVCYAWYIWSKQYNDKPTLDWI